MTIIVETGAGLSVAESYASVAAAAARWAGRRVYQHQALDWPRHNVLIDGFIVPSTIVPADVVNACIDLAVHARSGEDLLPDLDTGSNAIERDKVGPIDTEYFQNNTDARAFRGRRRVPGALLRFGRRRQFDEGGASMTIIARDGKTLAADKHGTNSGCAYAVTKIHRVPGGQMAFSGSGSHAAALLNWFEAGRPADAYSIGTEENGAGSMFIASDRKMVMYVFSGPHPE